MPSKEVLAQKQQYVEELTEQLKGAVAGVLVDYKGISVADDTALRRDFREAGVKYIVVKNTMLRFAAEKAGISGLDEFLNGTTAMAISDSDAVAPAKIAAKYDEKLKDIFNIKVGFMDGAVMSANDVVALGKLPSKEQLIGQLLSVLTGNIRGMAVALNRIAEQKESA